MAVVLMDGYEIDFANNTPGFAYDAIRTQDAVGTIYYQAGGAKDGVLRLYSAQVTHGVSVAYGLPSAATYLFNFHFKQSATIEDVSFANTNIATLLTLYDEVGQAILSFGITPAYRMAIYADRGVGSLLLGPSEVRVQDNRFYHICVRVTAGAPGTVQLWIDGTLVDTTTPNLSSNEISSFTIGYPYSSWNDGNKFDVHVDNLVVNNASGAVANTNLTGPIVERLDVDGDGTYTAWTGNGTGSGTYDRVNDCDTYGNTPDDATSYLSDEFGSTNKFLVTTSSPTISGTVLAVQANYYGRQAPNSAYGLQGIYRISSTDKNGNTIYFPPDWGWYSSLMPLNDGSPWGSLTDLEVGLQA